jgi:hypothetical protein
VDQEDKPAPGPPSKPSLSIQLTPTASQEGGQVRVSISATAPRAQLRTWSAFESLHESVEVTASHQSGNGPATSATTPLNVSADTPFELPAATLGDGAWSSVRLAYTVTDKGAGSTDFRIDPGKFVARGRAFLVLPTALQASSIATRITLELNNDYGPESNAASCLGVGPTREGDVTRAGLGGCAFAGSDVMGHAHFEGPEGYDETAWLGYTRFDPRPLAQWTGVSTGRGRAGSALLAEALAPKTAIGRQRPAEPVHQSDGRIAKSMINPACRSASPRVILPGKTP